MPLTAELEAIMKYRLEKSQQSDENVTLSTPAPATATVTTTTATMETSKNAPSPARGEISKKKTTRGDDNEEDDDSNNGSRLEQATSSNARSWVSSSKTNTNITNQHDQEKEDADGNRQTSGNSNVISQEKLQSKNMMKSNFSISSGGVRNRSLFSGSFTPQRIIQQKQKNQQQQQQQQQYQPQQQLPDIGTALSTESRPFDEHTPTPSFDSFKSIGGKDTKHNDVKDTVSTLRSERFMTARETNNDMNIDGNNASTRSKTGPLVDSRKTSPLVDSRKTLFDSQHRSVSNAFSYNNTKSSSYPVNDDARDIDNNDHTKLNVKNESSTSLSSDIPSNYNNNFKSSSSTTTNTFRVSSLLQSATAATVTADNKEVELEPEPGGEDTKTYAKKPHQHQPSSTTNVGIDVQRMRAILGRNPPPPPPPGRPPPPSTTLGKMGGSKKDRITERTGRDDDRSKGDINRNFATDQQQQVFPTVASAESNSSSNSSNNSISPRDSGDAQDIDRSGAGRLGVSMAHPYADQGLFPTITASGSSSSHNSNLDDGGDATPKKEEVIGGTYIFDSASGDDDGDNPITTDIAKTKKGGNDDILYQAETSSDTNGDGFGREKEGRFGFDDTAVGTTNSGDDPVGTFSDWANDPTTSMTTADFKTAPFSGDFSNFDVTPTATNIKDEDGIHDDDNNDGGSKVNNEDDNIFFDTAFSPFQLEENNNTPKQKESVGHGMVEEEAVNVNKDQGGDHVGKKRDDDGNNNHVLAAWGLAGFDFDTLRNKDVIKEGKENHVSNEDSIEKKRSSHRDTNLPLQPQSEQPRKFQNGDLSLISHRILTNHHHTSYIRNRDNNSASSKPLSFATLNPLSNNPIICRYRNRGWYIDEIDPSVSKCPLLQSTSISSSEIRHRLNTSKTSRGGGGGGRLKQQQQKQQQQKQQQQPFVIGIDNVQSIAAGVHTQHSRLRVRVAAVLDLLTLSQQRQSTTTSTTSTTSILRVVVVWQWGYGPGKPVALQNVVIAPRNRVYDPKTLCVADGLVFLGGSLGGSPVVFFGKPHVRDAWSSTIVTTKENMTTAVQGSRGDSSVDAWSSTVLLTTDETDEASEKTSGGDNSSSIEKKERRRKSPVRVVALAVTTNPQRNNKYLAIALDDGTVSVWGYDLVVATNRLPEIGSKTGSSSQALKPICRLQGSTCLEGVDCSMFLSNDDDGEREEGEEVVYNDEGTVTTNTNSIEDGVDGTNIMCTQLTWIPSRSPGPMILLLAAAFPRGVAVYNIIVPPTTTTTTMVPANSNHSSDKDSKGNSVINTSVPGPNCLDDAILLHPIAVSKTSPLLHQHRPPLRPTDIQNSNTIEDVSRNKKHEYKKDPQSTIPEIASVTWLNLGPLVPPCISVAFQSEGVGFLRVSVAALDLPLYNNKNGDSNDADYCESSDEHNDCTPPPRPLSILCEGQYPTTNSSSSLSQQAAAKTTLTDIYNFGSLGSMICHQSNGNLIVMYPTSSSGSNGKRRQRQGHGTMKNPQLQCISHPVVSAPLGITDTGFVLDSHRRINNNDDAYTSSYYDDILHVHSNLHCQIKDTHQRNWAIPSMRYWLCKTMVGDQKESKSSSGTTRNKLQESKQQRASFAAAAAAANQEGDFPTGGANLSVICELTCGDDNDWHCCSSLGPNNIVTPQQRRCPKSLIPHRISRDTTGEYCTVLFRSGFEPKKKGVRINPAARIYADPILFMLVNTNTHNVITTSGGGVNNANTNLRRGRDVVFLPKLKPNRLRFLTLKTNVHLEEVSLLLPNDRNDDIKLSNRDNLIRNVQVPIFPKGSAEESSIEVHRLFVVTSSKLSSRIFFIGSDRSNGRYCMFYGGEWTDQSAVSASILRAGGNDLVKLWFHQGEMVLSLIELPSLSSLKAGSSKKKGNRNFCGGNIAVATTTRVMILSHSPSNNDESSDHKMIILAEKKAGNFTCPSLVPIGSHCVAFLQYLSTNRTSGGARLVYLSCLPPQNHRPSGGLPVIATLPSPRYSSASSYLLLAVRPDRFLYLTSQSGCSTGMMAVAAKEHGDRMFLSPIPHTRPLCLLEPLIANALCCKDNNEDQKHNNTVKLNLIEKIIERFGRKSISLPHGDKEGIGTFGAGVTTAVYDMLSNYHLHDGGKDGNQALFYLMKGYDQQPNNNNTTPDHTTADFSSSFSGKCLPPWIPATTKAKATKSYAAALHAITSGDHYLVRIATSTATTSKCDSLSLEKDDTASCVMPHPVDPTSTLSRKFAKSALDKGSIVDAIKLFDLSGSPSSEKDLTLLILSLQLFITSSTTSQEKRANEMTNIVESLLSRLCGNVTLSSGVGFGGSGGSRGQYDGGIMSSISAIALALKMQMNQKNISRQMTNQLAPSVQKGICTTRRSRNLLLGSSALGGIEKLLFHDNDNEAGNEESKSMVGIDYERKHKSLVEANNIWSTGPFGDKEEILLLDRIEEWLGRSKPAKMGKVGADIAAESGERTLQNILAAAKKYSEAKGSGDNDQEETSSTSDSFKEGWVDGIGEGRTDEDNLTLYLRFSEGVDEDSNWKVDGLSDLSSYQNEVKLIQPDLVDIEATTSYIDEGEAGKIKLLHDLMFNRSINPSESCGILVEVKRGSSLDTGMLHSLQHESRQRSTIEFSYFLPSETETREIVLARRSVCFPGDTMENLCSKNEKDSILWELVALPSGRLEFRSGDGRSLLDSTSPLNNPPSSSLHQSMREDGMMTIERDDSNEDEEETDYGLVSRRTEDDRGGWNHVCLTFSSRGLDSHTQCEVSLIMKGVLVASSTVSIEPPSLEKEDLSDIDNINQALERSALMFGLGAVAGVRITDIRCWACKRSIDDVKTMMYECLHAAEIKKKIKIRIRNKGLPKKPPEATELKKTPYFAPPKEKTTKRNDNFSNGDEPASQTSQTTFSFAAFESSPQNSSTNIASELPKEKEQEGNLFANQDIVSFPQTSFLKDTNVKNVDAFASNVFQNEVVSNMDKNSHIHDDCSIKVHYNYLLSEEVRNSAAAALVRGPPATRHFGGNRGGLRLKNNVYQSSSKIGSIAICGSEKTVIFTYDKQPPGKTYPIGASGAIISDLMDDNKSEYLCCFLAKDKRMIVFDLYNKTIVAQMQMSTKLNFWRFLPPVCHGGKLVFLLITPAGGFHWMPLDESTRPLQVWKRKTELQGKKIVAYEEGGSNGLAGNKQRSTIALLLTSLSISSDQKAPNVEAWCIPIFGISNALKVSSNILGAALYASLPNDNSTDSFEPFLVTVSEDQVKNGINVEIFSLTVTNILQKGPPCSHITLDLNIQNGKEFHEPAMAMGTLPQAFCLCCGEYVVVILRAMGVLFALTHVNNELSCVEKQELGHFVVEAAIKYGKEDGVVEVVALLCEQNNLKDGQVVTIHICQQNKDVHISI